MPQSFAGNGEVENYVVRMHAQTIEEDAAERQRISVALA